MVSGTVNVRCVWPCSRCRENMFIINSANAAATNMNSSAASSTNGSEIAPNCSKIPIFDKKFGIIGVPIIANPPRIKPNDASGCRVNR